MSKRSLVVVALVLAGCKGGGATETDLETVFCDLLGNGPSDPVTLVASGVGPDLVREDRAVEITLVEDGGMFSGLGSYAPDEAGSFAVGLSDDVPVVFRDAAGSEVPFDAEVSGGCADLAVRYTVPLEIETYTVEFGPTATASLGMVSEESDDDL